MSYNAKEKIIQSSSTKDYQTGPQKVFNGNLYEECCISTSYRLDEPPGAKPTPLKHRKNN